VSAELRAEFLSLLTEDSEIRDALDMVLSKFDKAVKNVGRK
jgi:hypothetical protein